MTATRTAQALTDVLPSTTLLSRSDIDNSQASDVLSLLRRQAGIEMAQNGGMGATASLFMRGANSNHVLVLVDGLRINSVGSGAPLLSQLMLDQVDHIEIVRGNVSSLYGSEAIGGVVQIFTRSAGQGALDQPSYGFDAQVGGDDTRAFSAFANGRFGSEGLITDANLAVSNHSTKGFSAIDTQRASFANPDKDGYRNTSTSLQLAQHIGAQEIGLRVLDSHGNLDFDNTSDGPTETHREKSSLTTSSLYANLHFTKDWTSSLQYGEAHDRSVSTSSAPLSFSSGTTDNRTQEFSWNNSYQFAPAQQLTAGYENLRQKGSATAYGASFTRNVNALLAGYIGSFDAHELQVNLRHDDYSDFGTADTGLIAYGYRLTQAWKAIAQASTAYKAPTFNDLYYPFFGNPALKPERARSLELALQYAQGKDSFRAAVFRTRTRDLINYDASIFKAANIDRARVQGLELIAGTEWLGWMLSGNLSLQRPIDEKTNQPLLRRAHRNFNIAVSKSVGSWHYSADLENASARYDYDINTFDRIQLPAYSVANAGVRYALNPHVSLGLAVTNLFDKHYNLVDGYNTAGRVASASISTRF